MKKIIVVNDFDFIQGGASNVAIESCKLLYNEGCDVTLFSAVNNKTDYPFKSISFFDKEVASGQSKLRNIYNRKAIKELRKLINPENEYIIWIHGWTKSMSSSIFKIGKLSNVKVYLTIHDYFTLCPNGGFFNYKKNKICKLKGGSIKCFFCNCDSRNYIVKLYRFIRDFIQKKVVKIHKYIDCIITISDFSERIVKSRFPNIQFKRINNPVSIEKSDSRNMCESSYYYVYIGRLDKEKGVEDICLAASKTNIELYIIGDGVEKNKLLNKFSSYENIKFIGWLKHKEAMKYLKGARCLLFPSLWYEGAPLTIFESISYGVPCIISDASAATDFINDNNGFIYRTGNIEELKEKIKITFDDNIVKKKSINAFNDRNKITSNDKYIKKVIDLFFEEG